MTQSGLSCVDWAGEFGLSGARCRNPDGDVAPWCFVAEDHSQRDYCDNECPEAVEYSPQLQSAVSTLAGGPLGVGDKAENLDVELIMKSCNKEGFLLHPTKPATVIDLYFTSPEYREVWTGYSTVGDHSFGFIFLAEVEKALSLSSFDLNLDEAFLTDVLLWQNYPEGSSHQQVIAAGEDVILPPCGGFLNFCLFYTSPAISAGGKDLFILGERSKWAPISPQRISGVSVTSEGVSVSVSGVEGERVVLSFSDGEVFDVACDFQVSGSMTIDVLSRVCSSLMQ